MFFLRLLLLCSLLAAPLHAALAETRLTAYGGVDTTYSFTQVVNGGKFYPNANLMGLAADTSLADLGWGFTLEGEGQVAHFFNGLDYTTLNAGLGVRYAFPWSWPTSLAVYSGPSWADNPPVIATKSFNGRPTGYARKKWLNYVGAELAVKVSGNWSGVVRFYHRSGAFGLYAEDADEGNVIGGGIQYRF